MDISSTTSQVCTPAETSATAQMQKTSSKSDSSFKDEMTKVSDNQDTKTDTKSESKNESSIETKSDSNADVKTETKADAKVEENKSETQNINLNNAIDEALENNIEHNQDLSRATLLSGEISFQTSNSEIQNLQVIDMQTQALIDANVMLSEVVSDTKTPVKVDYTTIQMDMNDTQFFTELVQNTDKTIQNVVTQITQNPDADVKEIQKNIKVSATLMTALSEAVKNKQSFRIDFDKDISVIIKVDRDGAITARFIPGDGAVEQYLKQNISTLRQRFDDQELAYNELSYTGQQKRNKKNNDNNKENGHE